MMDYFKSSLFFITFAFLVTQIECEDDFHLEFSERYNSSTGKWIIDKFLPQLDNAPQAKCVRENGTLVPEHRWANTSQEMLVPLSLSSHTLFGLRVPVIPQPLPPTEATWLTFGSCISGIDQLSDRSKYFSETSKLFNTYNMNDILRQSNITPGKNYTYKEISDAVSKVTQGKKPVVKCLWYYGRNHLILDEITLFFDKSLNLIDPLKHHYPGKCSPDLPIFYEDANSNSDISGLLYYPPFRTYDDPLDKYPTLREDDNGYYLLSQNAYPADCPIHTPTKCQKPKYSWIIGLFTFIFKNNIDFTCDPDGNDPHNYKAKYNFTSLSSIKDEVVDKWGINQISLYSRDEEVIGRYWRQRGQCSTYFKGLDNEFKFYKKSLELFDKYNMDAILRQSNIVPGSNYTYQQISDAASNGIGGKQAKITCTPYAKEGAGRQILSTIEFYMDKNFNPTNPTDIKKPFEDPFTCNPDGLIFYQELMNYVDQGERREKPIYIDYH